jgi:hypothetical protein
MEEGGDRGSMVGLIDLGGVCRSRGRLFAPAEVHHGCGGMYVEGSGDESKVKDLVRKWQGYSLRFHEKSCADRRGLLVTLVVIAGLYGARCHLVWEQPKGGIAT